MRCQTVLVVSCLALALSCTANAQAKWRKLTTIGKPPVGDSVGEGAYLLVDTPKGMQWWTLFRGSSGWKWNRLSYLSVPTRRVGFGYARGFVFGGDNGKQLLNDTWLGRLLAPRTSPPPQRGHAMAVHKDGAIMVGVGQNGGTWRIDQASMNWGRVTGNPVPNLRDASMAIDRNGMLVLFGGRTSATSGWNNTTWLFDGKRWTQVKPKVVPPARVGHGMVYDAFRKRLVMFGGWRLVNGKPQSFTDTWEWDGADWIQTKRAFVDRGTNTSRNVAMYVRSPSFDHSAVIAVNEQGTFIYEVSTLPKVESSILSCHGGPHSGLGIRIDSVDLPWVGESFEIDLYVGSKSRKYLMFAGVSDRVWGNVRLPFPIRSLGLPSRCSIKVSLDYVVAVQGAERSKFNIQVPNSPGLVGQSLYLQAINWDDLKGFQYYASNKMKLTFGMK